jgi:hypothetical protein
VAAVTVALAALLKNAERRAQQVVQYKLEAIARAMLESRRGTDDGAIDDIEHVLRSVIRTCRSLHRAMRAQDRARPGAAALRTWRNRRTPLVEALGHTSSRCAFGARRATTCVPSRSASDQRRSQKSRSNLSSMTSPRVSGR